MLPAIVKHTSRESTLAHLRLVVYKIVLALMFMGGGLDFKLTAEVDAEEIKAEWIEKEQYHSSRQPPIREQGKCRHHLPLCFSSQSRPTTSPLPPTGHVLSNSLRAPLRC